MYIEHEGEACMRAVCSLAACGYTQVHYTRILQASNNCIHHYDISLATIQIILTHYQHFDLYTSYVGYKSTYQEEV